MSKKEFYLLIVFLLLPLTGSLSQSRLAASPGIERMGSSRFEKFDDNWLFYRYGIQANGSSVNEPDGLENPNLDDSQWRKLNLPHDWAIEGPFRIDIPGGTGKLPYKGIGWYRKHFNTSTEDMKGRVFIDFDGAMANAKVWLNGKYVGTWPYGYNSFRLDLTPFLKEGNNVLSVRLDTEKWDSRWYPGAGIYRHVWLVKTASVHVAHWGTYVTTPKVTDQSATIKMSVDIENQNAADVEATILTDIYELDIDNNPKKKVGFFPKQKVVIAANAKNRLITDVVLKKPKRWDISSPNRYLARTKVMVAGKTADTYNTPFGIRTLEFTPRNGFLLNGRRVEIKGVCNHHDLGALGAAFNESALKRQMLILKEMGCNSWRTSHNPAAPELYELADKMGFLVQDEAFDCWENGKREWDYNKLYKEWHEKDLISMVHRTRNHPSVFMWSVGNEVAEQTNVVMTKHLADIVRREDPTRPVTAGYNNPDGGRASSASMGLDVMGVNYFFSQQAKWDKDDRYKNMPTIGTETSSCLSTRGEYFFDGTTHQYWQISSYDVEKPGWGCTPDEQFRTNAAYPHLLGEYVWTGFDYLGEPTPFNSDRTNLLNFRTDTIARAKLALLLEEMKQKNPPSRSSYFGIIDLAGFPKDRYYLYQAHWRPDLPMVHILPHWNWADRMGKVVPIHVYTSGTEAELFVNGKSMGRKSKKANVDFRLIWDEVVYEPGVVEVVAYKRGKEWARSVMKTTGEANKIGLTADRYTLNSDASDMAYVTVKIQDKDGLTVPRTHNDLKFVIEGAGEIVATDNGDPTSFESFQSKERKAFNGQALVIVKAKKGTKGTIRVKAVSEGLATGEIVLQSK